MSKFLIHWFLISWEDQLHASDNSVSLWIAEQAHQIFKLNAAQRPLMRMSILKKMCAFKYNTELNMANLLYKVYLASSPTRLRISYQSKHSLGLTLDTAP